MLEGKCGWKIKVFYLSVMAATKQVILHSPHPLQRSLSISKVLEIACCGQAVWQSRQV